jgi:hypothetical protein
MALFRRQGSALVGMQLGVLVASPVFAMIIVAHIFDSLFFTSAADQNLYLQHDVQQTHFARRLRHGLGVSSLAHKPHQDEPQGWIPSVSFVSFIRLLRRRLFGTTVSLRQVF